MAKKQDDDSKFVTVTTPVGVLSYPFILKPDVGRKESSGKFSAEIYIPKAEFKTSGKVMYETVLKFAREFFKKPKLQLKDIQSPFKDMDEVEDCPEWAKGTIRVRAKAGVKGMAETDYNRYRPTVISPTKVDNKFEQFSLEEIAKIKGGDHVRFICSVYGYTQQGGGVALGLNFVQFAKVGKAIGQGRMKAIEDLTELEVEAEDPSELVDSAEESPKDSDVDPMMDFS